MSLPGFTAEVSIYQSAQRYLMASSLAPARGVGLASIATTLNPFMPSGGGNGTSMCYPKGCLQCQYPGYRDCHNQDYPDCTWRQVACDWYGNLNINADISPEICLYYCTETHCNGGVCDTVWVDCPEPLCTPLYPDCPAAPLPSC